MKPKYIQQQDYNDTFAGNNYRTFMEEDTSYALPLNKSNIRISEDMSKFFTEEELEMYKSMIKNQKE